MSSRTSPSAGGSPVGGGVRLDLLSIEDRSERSGRSKSNPSTGRISNAQLATNTAVNSPSFEVGHITGGDVFASPPKALPPSFVPKASRSVTTTGPSSREVTMTAPQTLDTPPQGLRSRSSGLITRHHVGGVDAQGVYPPTACVFVANLPEPRDDRSLEAAVTREFSKYGTVFVKIRRDNQHMPFAFCQYTRDEDAKAAMEHGKGTMILGRACRTEMVKANRTFVAYKVTNDGITAEEVRALLAQYGPMSKCELLHPQLQEALGIPRAVVVEFAMFDPSRDLQSAFRHHHVWRVQPYDLKRNVTTSRPNADELYLARYETDRRSVYVGNISPDFKESDLKAMFGTIGKIADCQMVRRQVNPDSVMRVFAFIEFEQPDLPDVAIEKFNQVSVRGMTLRVERKVMKEQTPTARRSRSQMMSYNSPTDAGPSSSPYGQYPSAAMAQSSTTRPPSWNWVAGPQQSPYGVQGAVPQGNPQTPGMYGNSPYYAPNYWPTMPYGQEYMMPTMGFYPNYTSPVYQALQSAGQEETNTPSRPGHSGTGPSQPSERSRDNA